MVTFPEYPASSNLPIILSTSRAAPAGEENELRETVAVRAEPGERASTLRLLRVLALGEGGGEDERALVVLNADVGGGEVPIEAGVRWPPVPPLTGDAGPGADPGGARPLLDAPPDVDRPERTEDPSTDPPCFPPTALLRLETLPCFSGALLARLEAAPRLISIGAASTLR